MKILYRPNDKEYYVQGDLFSDLNDKKELPEESFTSLESSNKSEEKEKSTNRILTIDFRTNIYKSILDRTLK